MALNLGSEFTLKRVGVCLTRVCKRLKTKPGFGSSNLPRTREPSWNHRWHTLCTARGRTAAPAGQELRLQLLPALAAGPGLARRRGRRLLQSPQRRRLEWIFDPELRPRLEHRQIAESSCQVLIA